MRPGKYSLLIKFKDGDAVVVEAMLVSPRHNVGDWKALKFLTEEDWQKAIDIIEDHIRGRFLDIIDSVESQRYTGFAVLALDCLLIETLQQFREGQAKTPRRKAKEYFVRFLTETTFRSFFKRKAAEMFYEQICCGILNGAQVRGSSQVISRRWMPLVSFTDDKRGLAVNPRLFHRQLVAESLYYIDELRKNEPTNEVLRQNAKKKMDHICRVHSGSE